MCFYYCIKVNSRDEKVEMINSSKLFACSLVCGSLDSTTCSFNFFNQIILQGEIDIREKR